MAPTRCFQELAASPQGYSYVTSLGQNPCDLTMETQCNSSSPPSAMLGLMSGSCVAAHQAVNARRRRSVSSNSSPVTVKPRPCTLHVHSDATHVMLMKSRI